MRRLAVYAGFALAAIGVAALLATCAAARSHAVPDRGSAIVARLMGATDRFVATRLAVRALSWGAAGAVVGVLTAIPVVLLIADRWAPFAGREGLKPGIDGALSALPMQLWLTLGATPPAIGIAAFATVFVAVSRWLRTVP